MTWIDFRLLLWGTGVTAFVSAVSVVIGLSLGVLICAAGMARARWLRRCAGVYVSFFRGVPLLVQLLLIYHLLPRVGLNVPSLVAAIAGMALCTAAYQAENLRGGFLNIPPGMVEAAQMLGLSNRQILLRIRLPVALRLTLPAVVNEAIMILKASSLVSVVGVEEVTRIAQNISAVNFDFVPIFSTAAGLYLVLNLGLTWLGSRVGRQLRTASA